MSDHASDGLVHGQPFFQPGSVGGARAQALRTLGPAASTVFGVGLQDPLQVDGQKVKGLAQAMAQSRDPQVQQSIQLAKQENVLRGMQAVAMGKTLNQVEAEQPWYSKLFGNSDTVLGARMYVTATAGNAATAGLMDAMGEIKKLNPEQARKAIMTHMSLVRTGDPAIDLQVQEKLLQSFPQVMDSYTKQHIQWEQEELGKQQTANFHSRMDVANATLQQLVRDPESAGDHNEAAALVAEMDLDLNPIAGQDPDVYKGNITKLLEGEIGRIGEETQTLNPDGSVSKKLRSAHAITAYIAGSERFKQLYTPEEQNYFKAKLATAGQKAMNKAALPYMKEIVNLQSQIAHPPPGVTGNMILKRIEDINREISLQSGIGEDYFDGKDKIGNLTRFNVAVAQRREAERMKALQEAQQQAAQANQQALKEQLEQLRQAQIQKVLYSGGVNADYMLDQMNISQKERERVLDRMFQTGTEQEQEVLIQQQQGKIPALQNKLRGQMLALKAKDDTNFLQSVDEINLVTSQFDGFRQKYGDEATRTAYGKDYGMMRKVSEALSSGGIHAAMTAMKRGILSEGDRPAASKEDREAALKAVEAQTGRWAISGLWDKSYGKEDFHGVTFDPQKNPKYMEDLAQEVAHYRKDGLTIEESARLAIRSLNQRYDILGGQAIEQIAPSVGITTRQLLQGKGVKATGEIYDRTRGIPPDAIDESWEAFQGSLKVKFPQATSITPVGNTLAGEGGEVIMMVVDQYGKSTYVPVPVQSIIDSYEERKKHSLTGGIKGALKSSFQNNPVLGAAARWWD